MRIRAFYWLGVLAGLAAAAPAGAAEPSVKIGEVVSLTGPANFYGIPENRAIQLAVSEINAAGGVRLGGVMHPLELVAGDDQGSPTSGVAALKKLMADDVHFVIGPVVSGVAAALKPIVEQSDDLTQIVDGATVDGVTNGHNVFRNQTNIVGFEAPLIALIKARGFATAAMMSDRFHAAQMGTEPAFAAALDAQGNKVVAREYYKLGDTSFAAQLTKIKALNPAILVMRGYATETALMVRQARQLGYTGAIAWEGVAPPSAVLKNITGAEMEGVFNSFPPTVEDFATLGSAKAKHMVEAYKKMFNADPGELSGISYDSVYIFKAALEMAGAAENARVDAALAALKVTDVPERVSVYDPVEGGKFFDKAGQAAMRGGVHVWHGDGWAPIPE